MVEFHQTVQSSEILDRLTSDGLTLHSAGAAKVLPVCSNLTYQQTWNMVFEIVGRNFEY